VKSVEKRKSIDDSKPPRKGEKLRLGNVRVKGFKRTAHWSMREGGGSTNQEKGVYYQVGGARPNKWREGRSFLTRKEAVLERKER